jgi:hypothetical protein
MTFWFKKGKIALYNIDRIKYEDNIELVKWKGLKIIS